MIYTIQYAKPTTKCLCLVKWSMVFLVLTVVVRFTHLVAFVPWGTWEAPLSFDPLSHRSAITGKKQEQEKHNMSMIPPCLWWSQGMEVNLSHRILKIISHWISSTDYLCLEITLLDSFCHWIKLKPLNFAIFSCKIKWNSALIGGPKEEHVILEARSRSREESEQIWILRPTEKCDPRGRCCTFSATCTNLKRRQAWSRSRAETCTKKNTSLYIVIDHSEWVHSFLDTVQ